MLLDVKEKREEAEENITKLYNALEEQMLLAHPFLKKENKDSYSPAVVNSLAFLFGYEKITIEYLREELSWFLNRLDNKHLKCFGNEKLAQEIMDFRKCGVRIDIYFHSKEKARFSFDYKFTLNSTKFWEHRLEKTIRKYESWAVERFGYKNDKWILQDTFSGGFSSESVKKRVADYKKFIALEFLNFVENWSDFLSNNEENIKKSYQEISDGLIKDMQKGDFQWLQQN